MADYNYHFLQLNNARKYINNRELSFEVDCVGIIDQVASEMLATIQELEKKINTSDIAIYKKRLKIYKGKPSKEIIIQIGSLGKKGQFIFNPAKRSFIEETDSYNLYSELYYTFNAKTKKYTEISSSKYIYQGATSLVPPSNDKFFVVGYVNEQGKLVYYDQIVD